MVEKLSVEWEESEELFIILGNFYCAGTEIDALVVKNDSISIVDFKDYGGEIIFSENSDWKADGVNIKGGNKTNPYLQVHFNKFELLNYLKEKNIFNEGNNVNLGHISGIILFHQHISFDNNSIP
ncbi:NERD domain-containing protein, partial [Patescibacteria group bacterium]|nr:NERD domain-containing protein [Patescibacteria group bacterium]